VVSSGRAAIEAVATGEYTLVLMDCQMPEIDGYMATAEIRRREAVEGLQGGRPGRRVPIVALTASRVDADQERCLAAGMDAYLNKPVDARQLKALIERWAPGVGVAAPPGASIQPPRKRTEMPLPIVDPAGLFGSDSAQHRELVALFLEEVPRRLSALSTAAARGDHGQVARLAHTLAGSADSLGAARLAAACARLERLARDRAPGSGGPLASGRLAEAIGAVHEELQQLQAAVAGRVAERDAHSG
jgi:CheY-like chemotaxis protein